MSCDLQALERLSALQKWIESHGGFIHPALEFRASPANANDFTLFSTAELRPWEDLIKIPGLLQLNPENIEVEQALKEPWLSALEQHNFFKTRLNRAGPMLWALLVAKDQDQESFFAPYINALPQKQRLVEHPVFWCAESRFLNETEYLNALERWKTLSPTFANIIQASNDELKIFMHTLKQLNHRYPLFSASFLIEENIRWALAILFSRRWHDGLIPAIDQLQHHGHAKSFVSDFDDEPIIFFAGEKYASGAEVLNNYGNHDNHEMLYNFGFFNEEDCQPVVAIRLHEIGNSSIEHICIQSLSRTLSALRETLSLTLCAEGPNAHLLNFLQMRAFHLQSTANTPLTLSEETKLAAWRTTLELTSNKISQIPVSTQDIGRNSPCHIEKFLQAINSSQHKMLRALQKKCQDEIDHISKLLPQT